MHTSLRHRNSLEIQLAIQKRGRIYWKTIACYDKIEERQTAATQRPAFKIEKVTEQLYYLFEQFFRLCISRAPIIQQPVASYLCSMADAYFPQDLDSGLSRVPGRQRDLLVAPMAPPSFANSGTGDGGCGRSQPTIFFDGRGAPGVETRHVDILVSGITISFMLSPLCNSSELRHCIDYRK